LPVDEYLGQRIVKDLLNKCSKKFGEKNLDKVKLYPLNHKFWKSFSSEDLAFIQKVGITRLVDFQSRTVEPSAKYKWKDPKMSSATKYFEQEPRRSDPLPPRAVKPKWRDPANLRGSTYQIGNCKPAFTFLRKAWQAGEFICSLSHREIHFTSRKEKHEFIHLVTDLLKLLSPDGSKNTRWWTGLASRSRHLLNHLRGISPGGIG